MTPTPNTPASADIDILIRETLLILDAELSADNRTALRICFDKAIERDRAEREAELASVKHLAAAEKQRIDDVLDQEQEALAKCKAKLAEREAELVEAIEWKERYQRTAHINARDADNLARKLAEQSAALALAKTFAEKIAAERYQDLSAAYGITQMGVSEACFDDFRDTAAKLIAQIEALAEAK